MGLLWQDVAKSTFLTSWPIDDARIIAWAILFPNRDILVFFVIPMRGRHLIYFTVGFTVVLALYSSFSGSCPTSSRRR